MKLSSGFLLAAVVLYIVSWLYLRSLLNKSPRHDTLCNLLGIFLLVGSVTSLILFYYFLFS